MEDITRMAGNPEEGAPEIERSPADPDYIAPASPATGSRHRRLLAVAAAVAFVATCAAAFAFTRTDGRTREAETTPATEPAPTTTRAPEDAPCGGDPPATTTTVPAPGLPPTTSTVPASSTTGTTDPVTTTTDTTVPVTSISTTTPATSTTGGPGGQTGPDCGTDAPPTDPFTLPPGRERTPPDEDEAPPADAPLAERVEFAWRVGYLGNVEHTFTTDSRSGGTTSEMWWDDSTGAWRTRSADGAGTPVLDQGAAGFDGENPKGQRMLDYCFSEYMDWDAGPLVTPETKATRIRQDLDQGQLVEDGREEIDGRDTIRLRRADGSERMWLDGTTLLPVRTAGTWGSGGDYATTHEFIARTDETRQLIVPPIPAGFTKVEQTRGDGASMDAGC
jgi:hypothetical protein